MILFVSDLHLCSSRPETCRVFFDFLAGPARRAQALYILGDLFEYWAGDDDVGDPFNAQIVNALRGAQLTVHVMHGNRDFLLGPRFAEAASVHLIEDPILVDCNGVATLLTHGDDLCTDDSAYQDFRREVRSPGWIDEFLARPLAERKREIERLRALSEAEKKRKSAAIMDVNAGAVEDLLRRHGYPRLIHGHTHRPAQHVHVVDGSRCERWVLPDWSGRGGGIVCDDQGIRVLALDPP